MKRLRRLFQRVQEDPGAHRAGRTPEQSQEALHHLEDARRRAGTGELRDSTDWTRPRLERDARMRATG